MSVVVEIMLSENDIVRAAQFSFLSKPFNYIFIAICLLFGLIIITPQSVWTSVEDLSFVGLLWLMLLPAFVALSYWFSVPWQAKKNFRYNKKMQKLIFYSWNDTGFKLESEDFHIFTKWHEIYSLRQNRDYILINPQPRTMYILPKRYFSNEQLDEIIKLANR